MVNKYKSFFVWDQLSSKFINQKWQLGLTQGHQCINLFMQNQIIVNAGSLQLVGHHLWRVKLS